MTADTMHEAARSPQVVQDQADDRRRCESCGVRCSSSPFYGHTLCRDCDPVDWSRPTASARESRRAIVAAGRIDTLPGWGG
jgi:hypothetical protein